MAQTKSNKQFSSTTDSDKEFVAEGEDAQEKGYWGTRDNAFPDEAYALTTGPDSPIEDARGNPVDVEELEAEEKAVEKQAQKADKAEQKK